jgi:putative tryptophan/tyrosine transport system substrate-binding protein
MRRRDFIAGLGAAAAPPAMWPLAARAQQPVMPVIGYLSSESLDSRSELQAAFHRGLGDTGYVEGRNVAIEYRWAQSHYDRLPALAVELVRRQVTVIIADGTAAALATKAATSTIPIVFNIGSDPVKWGLVASFNRPGANVTGVSVLFNALEAKKLELLHDMLPKAPVIAMLVNPTNPNAEPDTKDAQVAARLLGLRLLVLNASDQGGIEAAFATLMQQQVSALMLGADLFFVTARNQIVALAARHRVAAIYHRREFTAAGGLMSYGPNSIDSTRQVGVYAGRILKGEKPGELPVMQPTKFELVVNLKAAKAIGLTIPESFLNLRADEVIE